MKLTPLPLTVWARMALGLAGGGGPVQGGHHGLDIVAVGQLDGMGAEGLKLWL